MIYMIVLTIAVGIVTLDMSSVALVFSIIRIMARGILFMSLLSLFTTSITADNSWRKGSATKTTEQVFGVSMPCVVRSSFTMVGAAVVVKEI